MQLPREVIIGKGVINKVTDVCRDIKLGLSSTVLILTGPKTYNIAAKKVIEDLEDQGNNVNYYIIEKSKMSYVNKAVTVADETGSEIILGVGGGKVIDVAKMVTSFRKIPLVSIPTAASHDGISSSRVSLKDLEKPISLSVQAPLAIIADTEIISNSPYRLTASGCGDISAKHTAVNDWKLAYRLKGEYYGEYAASLAMMSANLVLENACKISRKTEEGHRIVLEALISCGVAMSIAGSSRPCSGSEHLFSHALDMIVPKPALHGEQCGVGTIMMTYLQKRDWKSIREKLKIIGAPTTAKELRINSDHIINALTKAHTIRDDRYTILGTNGLTVKEAEHIARDTGVI
jgi:glycerol-1-phosphate dehydrogenase [NAD(P)+]